MNKILLTGALGQLGSELSKKLGYIYENENIIISDIRLPENDSQNFYFEKINVLNKKELSEIVKKHKITQIYHLAAILSAKGENDPKFTWTLNMEGLINVLDVAVENNIKQVYWPSSISVFGKSTPKIDTPQRTIMDPSTIYGISKLAGERWCKYYYSKYELDVRSLRYPGIIGYETKPGGGTTDYAIDMFFDAIEKGSYECFLKPDTYLPMMYIDDAISATIQLMLADNSTLKIRSSYNVSSMSLSPQQLANELKKEVNFSISYVEDDRQQIADSWPNSIDDSFARQDWAWQPKIDLNLMVKKMINGILSTLDKSA